MLSGSKIHEVTCLILIVAIGVRDHVIGKANTGPKASTFLVNRPHTPWGDPDLQGIWTSDDVREVPIERPRYFGNRRLLTDAEFIDRIGFNARARERALNVGGTTWEDVGTRTFRQTSLVVAPADGRIPRLTSEAQTREGMMAAIRRSPPAGWDDRSLYERCITRGVVGSILPSIYGNSTRIIQSPGFVAITYEMVHDTRLIPIDARPHVGEMIRLYLGDARGHWDGETLVIDTTNFTSRTSVGRNGNGTPHTEALHLVERFKRVGTNQIDYQVAINDTQTWRGPWTVALPLTSRPSDTFLPYECHEGNLGLSGILSAARTEERAIEEALRQGRLPPDRGVWRSPGNGRPGGLDDPPQ